ncbi:malonyl-ACP O-methyltransferase BioC [Pseudomarimonas salicorniae]|uniref:Malonyl-[acyl-carrier protein] O-methyltransferase n=1 Tax=Pseudomarimonas salicorniae TaxID=2933270 RepID=A0ABT0GG48_9GAMM|nr:malonyl-ACP O-methyltransferase BioC [Lysobacter sp. CAU 1642]MCK7593510.1 malonyl-ACP O-methyltransferase BioC [Lysobacter sp. CAU 1642]
MNPMLDLRQVRRAFSRAAPDYAATAVLQAEVRTRLLEQLDYLQAAPARILDLGCGPGIASRLLKQRWPKAEVVAMDLALPMLQQARGEQRLLRRFARVCADVRALPIADASCDLLFSNLCFQWVEDLPVLLAELRRVLRPNGMLLFSTFAQGTLEELREAFAVADPGQAHVSRFAHVQQIGDAILAAGFRDPVLDTDRFTLTYQHPRELMQELRTIGAGNASQTRRRGLTGPKRMEAVYAAYEAFREAGRLPATYEVVYAHAWGPDAGQPRRHAGAEIASFPVSSLKVRRREG